MDKAAISREVKDAVSELEKARSYAQSDNAATYIYINNALSMLEKVRRGLDKLQDR